MTKVDLDTLSEVMHNLIYVVPGKITSFQIEFKTCHVSVELDEDTDEYRVAEVF